MFKWWWCWWWWCLLMLWCTIEAQFSYLCQHVTMVMLPVWSWNPFTDGRSRIPPHHMYHCTTYVHMYSVQWVPPSPYLIIALPLCGHDLTFYSRSEFNISNKESLEECTIAQWISFYSPDLLWGGTAPIWGEVWPNFFFTYVKHWMETFIIIMQTLREHIKHM